jgi:chromosome partitioning protein
MAYTVAVLNQKGGVGKTTTCINLAAYLCKLNKKVLLIDLDPQGNSTSGLGIDKNHTSFNTLDMMSGKVPLVDAIHQTSTEGLYVVPANQGMSAAEAELSSISEREYLLRNAIAATASDTVLLDCPPSLGMLTVNALTAADSLLIPVQAEYYALEGLGQLMSTFQRVRATTNKKIELLGILVTMFDKRNGLAEQVLHELRSHFGDKVFGTLIPRNVRLAEAPSFGKTIADHDSWSKGARAYKSAAKELIKRIESTS